MNAEQSTPDVVDRLNSDPATEFAVYIPKSDSYTVDNDNHQQVFQTVGEARYRATVLVEYDDQPFEVHSRLNYAVTPWRKVES